jgi:acyl dehydratase
MPIDYQHLMSLKSEGDRFHYTDRETMLYAVGIGMGRDPLDEKELAYVWEGAGLKTVPSLATVLTRTNIMRGSGLDYARVLHGEQKLTLHRPLPIEGELIADTRVTEAYDKGVGKGAVIYTETRVRLASDNRPLYTLNSTVFARGDGGFGGPKGSGAEPHVLPERKPDLTATVETRPDQAILYRLNGDRNPVHIDPKLAKTVGFHMPILHGLCTYGNACRTILKAVCDYDHTRIAGLDVRFSSPVYPGEKIATDMWVDGSIVSFRCRVPERDVVVVNNGKCTLKG